MKKLVSLLLTVCMCLSAFVMLTACDEEHTHTYKTEWSKDTTHHWHACEGENCTDASDKAEHTWNEGAITTDPTAEANGEKTFTCTVCNATKGEPVVFTGINENQYNSIMSMDNYSNYTLVQDLTQTINGQPFNAITTFKVTSTVMVMKQVGDQGEFVETMSGSDVDEYKQMMLFFTQIAYDDITYDSENDVYATDETYTFKGYGIDYNDIKITISQNKVVYVETDIVTNDQEIGTMKITISDYGTTVVELSEGVTEEEWNAMLAPEAFTNYTVVYGGTVTQTDSSGGVVAISDQSFTLKFNEDKLYAYGTVKPEGAEEAFVLVNGIFTGEDYHQMKASYETIFLALLAEYENFEYNSAENIYELPSAVEVTVDFGEPTIINMNDGRVSISDDGKLLTFVCNYSQTSGGYIATSEMTYTFTDYGTTVVEMPTVNTTVTE